MSKIRSKKIRVGDVYAIPLPNKKYAFGRVFKDANIAIYKHIGDALDDLPMDEDYQFIVGVYKDVLQSGKWLIVDYRPFDDDEYAWPPPMCVIDKISEKFSIYYKGHLRASTKSECDGLEEAAVWEEEHIVDRIMGEDKWHRH